MNNNENQKDLIKRLIEERGTTFTNLIELLNKEHNHDFSSSSFSRKLSNNTLKYDEALQIASLLGFEIIWLDIKKKTSRIFTSIGGYTHDDIITLQFLEFTNHVKKQDNVLKEEEESYSTGLPKLHTRDNVLLNKDYKFQLENIAKEMNVSLDTLLDEAVKVYVDNLIEKAKSKREDVQIIETPKLDALLKEQTDEKSYYAFLKGVDGVMKLQKKEYPSNSE